MHLIGLVKYGVWIKAGPQPSFTAEPGGKKQLSQSELDWPFWIDLGAVLHMNLIHLIRFSSYEVRRLNWA